MAHEDFLAPYLPGIDPVSCRSPSLVEGGVSSAAKVLVLDVRRGRALAAGGTTATDGPQQRGWVRHAVMGVLRWREAGQRVEQAPRICVQVGHISILLLSPIIIGFHIKY